jgi:hypothetical protein
VPCTVPFKYNIGETVKLSSRKTKEITGIIVGRKHCGCIFSICDLNYYDIKLNNGRKIHGVPNKNIEKIRNSNIEFISRR